MSPILHPIDHGEVFPWGEIEPEDQVWMLDFSLRLSDMTLLKSFCKRFVWIDHHIGRIREYEADTSMHLEGLVDTNFAGCELAWKFFYPQLQVPRFVRLISLYDLWTHNDPIYDWDFVETFQNGMKTKETDPLKNFIYYKDWIEAESDRNLESFLMDDALEVGCIIGNYLRISQKRTIEKKTYIREWEGYKCLICNDASVANNLAESKMFEENNCQVAVTYSCEKGKNWSISLRSKDPIVDVSVLAKKYGGNGHVGASGFSWGERLLPWDSYRGPSLGFA